MDAHIRVLIVDDHELIRRGLRDYFATQLGLEVAGEASTLSQAIELATSICADVALIDVRLPDGDGLSFCEYVRRKHLSLRCLLLTSVSSDRLLELALRAGAYNVLLKDQPLHEIAGAIREVGRGRSLLSPERIADIFRRASERGDQSPLARLTSQERRVLELMAEGMTDGQIAKRMHLSDGTVRNYASRVLSKLGAKSRTEAAVLFTKLESSENE